MPTLQYDDSVYSAFLGNVEGSEWTDIDEVMETIERHLITAAQNYRRLRLELDSIPPYSEILDGIEGVGVRELSKVKNNIRGHLKVAEKIDRMLKLELFLA